MLKFFLSVLFLSVTAIGYSQIAETKEKPKDTIAHEVRYATFKKLYIQMRQSKSFQISDSIAQVFFYKITPDMDLIEISKENRDYFAWTKDNLSKTEFKDIAEAEKLWAAYEDAVKISTTENKEYYDYSFETRKFEGGTALQMDIMSEVRKAHPELFKRIKLPKRPKKKDLIPKVGPLKIH